MMRKAAGIYSIITGLSMLGMWVMFYMTNSIPELETEPIRIIAHLLAEGVTACLLIFSGAMIVGKREGFEYIYIFSMGMLIYTLIQSPGYFAQTGDIPFVIMFGCLLLCAIFFSLIIVRKVKKPMLEKVMIEAS